jgi:hypothetical protein
MEFVDPFAFRQKFSQYRQGDWYDATLLALAKKLTERLRERPDWQVAIDDLEGVDCIPVMTIHKSKGLEYHTVVFVGLEDSALWGFASAPKEEKCSFFVAFSRAIKRVILTFAESRPRMPGGPPEAQSRKKIGVLYELLEQAGVKGRLEHLVEIPGPQQGPVHRAEHLDVGLGIEAEPGRNPLLDQLYDQILDGLGLLGLNEVEVAAVPWLQVGYRSPSVGRSDERTSHRNESVQPALGHDFPGWWWRHNSRVQYRLRQLSLVPALDL